MTTERGRGMGNPVTWLRDKLTRFTAWWYTGRKPPKPKKAGPSWWARIETTDIDPAVRLLHRAYVLHAAAIDNPARWEEWAKDAEKFLKLVFGIAEDVAVSENIDGHA